MIPEAKKHLLKHFRQLVEEWPVRSVTRIEPDGLPREGASLVPSFRLVIPVCGVFRSRLMVNGEIIDRSFDASCALFAPPMGWTQEDWTSPHEAVSIIYNRDHVRFLSYLHEGDGRRLPQPQVWYHSAIPISPAGDTLLSALDQAARIGSNYSPDTIVALLHSLISLSADELEAEGPYAAEEAGGLYRDIVRYLEENVNRPLSRKTVACAFHIHPNHVSRLFRKGQHQSFSDTLKGLRMQRAVRLLETTDRPVEDVAALCGFSSSNYFIKVFRSAHDGLTPQAYRRKQITNTVGKPSAGLRRVTR